MRTVSALERYSKDISDGEIEMHRPKIQGWRLHALLTFCAGAGFTLFGYDQGVMSALITANQFEAIFPETVSPVSGPFRFMLLSDLSAAECTNEQRSYSAIAPLSYLRDRLSDWSTVQCKDSLLRCFSCS